MKATPWNNERSGTTQRADCIAWLAAHLVALVGALGPGWEASQWAELERAFTIITTDENRKSLCREELYRQVEDVCIEGYGGALYERVARLLFASAQTKASALSRSGDIIVGMATAWSSHAEQTKAIGAICLYLDRAYAAATPGVAGLWEVGSAAFRFSITESGLKESIELAVRKACRAEREGASIDVASVRTCTRMLAALGIYPDLETAVLREARDEAAAEARRLSCLDSGDRTSDAERYARCVLTRLEWADRVVDNYLEPSTRAPIVATIETELVRGHAARVCGASFAPLMEKGDRETLKFICGLLCRVGEAEVVRKSTRDYALTSALDVLKHGHAVVHEVLQLHARLRELCATTLAAASDEPGWANALLKDAFEEAVNNEHHATTFAETLADHIASVLSSSLASQSSLLKLLDGALLLFRFLRSKDVFEAFYRRALALKLFTAMTSNKPTSKIIDAEQEFIALLEAECGASYVAKLKGVCKDLDLARDVAAEFYRDASRDTSQAASPKLAPWVLTTGYWPTFAKTNLQLPAILSERKSQFERFYAGKFQGRRLTWQHDFDRCVLRAAYANGRKELDVSMAQATLLLCFNESATRTFDQIAVATGLDPTTDLTCLVDSLCGDAEFPLLIAKPHRSYQANPSFAHKSYFVVLPEPERPKAHALYQRAKVVDALAKDRQYAIDATIVRVMKARKTLPHQQLLAELLARLVHPAPPNLIKRRIESLIDREYLERDPHDNDSYNYLS